MAIHLRDSIAIPQHILEWIGRQGTRAIAALVVIGIAVPSLGDVLKPFVTEAIFALLCISFMRVDVPALRAHLRRPVLVVAATGWTTLAVPLICGLSGHNINVQSPDLFLALMLQAVASPMMASPTLVSLMGLDSTLVLITLVTSTAMMPLTAPLFAYLFLGHALALSPLAIGLKLFAILGGSLCVAAAIRTVVGEIALKRHKEAIDGLNVLFLFVFVAAVMGGVSASISTEPVKMIKLALFAFAVFFALLGVTTLIFKGIGREGALALGLMASQRNMGLMMAATNGALPELTWLYFALCQFPIYLSPLLLKPIVRRLTSRSNRDYLGLDQPGGAE